MSEAKIITASGLQWLILPDEGNKQYTNFGDGREGDSSEFVALVNGDPAMGLGHSDWRLPVIEELKSLITTDQAPRNGWYWASSPVAGFSALAWSTYFSDYRAAYGPTYRSDLQHVRLVRSTQ